MLYEGHHQNKKLKDTELLVIRTPEEYSAVVSIIKRIIEEVESPLVLKLQIEKTKQSDNSARVAEAAAASAAAVVAQAEVRKLEIQMRMMELDLQRNAVAPPAAQAPPQAAPAAHPHDINYETRSSIFPPDQLIRSPRQLYTAFYHGIDGYQPVLQLWNMRKTSTVRYTSAVQKAVCDKRHLPEAMFDAIVAGWTLEAVDAALQTVMETLHFNKVCQLCEGFRHLRGKGGNTAKDNIAVGKMLGCTRMAFKEALQAAGLLDAMATHDSDKMVNLAAAEQ
jgi:hypothetical protein